MGVWYSWAIDLPPEKRKKAEKIIARHNLENILEIEEYSLRDENNLPIPPEERTLTVSVKEEPMGAGEGGLVRSALEDLALLCKGTGLDGQAITVRYEGEEQEYWIINGELTTVTILSVEKVKGGLEFIVEAEVDGDAQYRYAGVMKEINE